MCFILQHRFKHQKIRWSAIHPLPHTHTSWHDWLVSLWLTGERHAPPLQTHRTFSASSWLRPLRTLSRLQKCHRSQSSAFLFPLSERFLLQYPSNIQWYLVHSFDCSELTFCPDNAGHLLHTPLNHLHFMLIWCDWPLPPLAVICSIRFFLNKQ